MIIKNAVFELYWIGDNMYSISINKDIKKKKIPLYLYIDDVTFTSDAIGRVANLRLESREKDKVLMGDIIIGKHSRQNLEIIKEHLAQYFQSRTDSKHYIRVNKDTMEIEKGKVYYINNINCIDLECRESSELVAYSG